MAILVCVFEKVWSSFQDLWNKTFKFTSMPVKKMNFSQGVLIGALSTFLVVNLMVHFTPEKNKRNARITDEQRGSIQLPCSFFCKTNLWC